MNSVILDSCGILGSIAQSRPTLGQRLRGDAGERDNMDLNRLGKSSHKEINVSAPQLIIVSTQLLRFGFGSKRMRNRF